MGSKLLPTLALAASALLLAACSSGGSQAPQPQEEKISASDQGKPWAGSGWPLKVQSGTLHCYPTNPQVDGLSAVTFSAGGREYALNGVAIDAARYENVGPIWLQEPSAAKGLHVKVDMGVLIAEGLRLCSSPATRATASGSPAS